MLENRIYNFSAGPSMLPEAVLLKAQKDMLNYEGSGMSVMEMSHRSKVYDKIISDTQANLRKVMGIPDNYKVLFLQGGATGMFAALPLNLAQTGSAAYIVTEVAGVHPIDSVAVFKRILRTAVIWEPAVHPVHPAGIRSR